MRVYLFVYVWWGVGIITNGLVIPRALYAPTISLEEYGVVLKPGHIMSIPNLDGASRAEVQ